MFNKVDHISIAVSDLDAEIVRYRDVLGLEYIGNEEVMEQKVKVALFKIGDIRIELTAPTGPDSTIAKFIKKRGAGIHHIALESNDIREQIKSLKDKGVRMIDETPRVGAQGARIAFAHPSSFSGVLFEIKQRE
jgi:methylmalonyl-CoA/ethylmalonyl-CoA epimerase